jgi:hypothetical protein
MRRNQMKRSLVFVVILFTFTCHKNSASELNGANGNPFLEINARLKEYTAVTRLRQKAHNDNNSILNNSIAIYIHSNEFIYLHLKHLKNEAISFLDDKIKYMADARSTLEKINEFSQELGLIVSLMNGTQPLNQEVRVGQQLVVPQIETPINVTQLLSPRYRYFYNLLRTNYDEMTSLSKLHEKLSYRRDFLEAKNTSIHSYVREIDGQLDSIFHSSSIFCRTNWDDTSRDQFIAAGAQF